MSERRKKKRWREGGGRGKRRKGEGGRREGKGGRKRRGCRKERKREEEKTNEARRGGEWERRGGWGVRGLRRRLGRDEVGVVREEREEGGGKGPTEMERRDIKIEWMEWEEKGGKRVWRGEERKGE